MSFEIFIGKNLVILVRLSTLRRSNFSNLLTCYDKTPFEKLSNLNNSLYLIPGFSSIHKSNFCWNLGSVLTKYIFDEFILIESNL